MERQACCRQTVRIHYTIRSEANMNLAHSCCSLKCTESWDILLLMEAELCLHTLFSVGLQVCVMGLWAGDECISFRKSLENGWKSKIKSMMADSPHRERITAQRRNPLTGGLVKEVDFFIPVIQYQNLQLFFSRETDTCFIAYLHSWIAETSNKQTCLSLCDRALAWKVSQRRRAPKAIHMALFLPLHTFTSYLCDWARLITIWSLLAQASLLDSQRSSGSDSEEQDGFC